MINCANCELEECFDGGSKSLNPLCPMQEKEIIEQAKNEFMKDENRDFYGNTLKVRHDFGGLCRMDETIAFCKYNNFKKIGLAYCAGMAKEGKIVNEILSDNGFEVVSAVCKFGALEAEDVSDCQEALKSPGKKKKSADGVAVVCNPIGQALLMNKEMVDFNVVVGLCVGHDSLFIKYATAMSTVLIAKDKPMKNNPAAALYHYAVHKKMK